MVKVRAQRYEQSSNQTPLHIFDFNEFSFVVSAATAGFAPFLAVDPETATGRWLQNQLRILHDIHLGQFCSPGGILNAGTLQKMTKEEYDRGMISHLRKYARMPEVREHVVKVGETVDYLEALKDAHEADLDHNQSRKDSRGSIQFTDANDLINWC